MTEEIKVSVIIPFYNSEKYAEELMDCLLNQTLDGCEFIFVDNASTDSGARIIERCAESDSRVRLLTEKTPGAGIARNRGLDSANGKYIMFFDSDDLCDSTMLERLFNRMEESNADMGVCSAMKTDYLFGGTDKLSSFSQGEDISSDGVYTFRDFSNVFTAFDVSPQNKMYRTDFVRENNLRFSSTRSANDLFFTEAARLSAGKIVFIREDLVTIRRNYDTSSLSTSRKKSSEDIVTVLKELYDFLVKKELDKELGESFIAFACRHIKYGSQQGENKNFSDSVRQWFGEEPWLSVTKEEFYDKMNFCFLHSELMKEKLSSQIEREESEDKRSALENRLETVKQKEKTISDFIDYFFGGDTELIEVCEARLIRKEYIGAYIKAAERAEKLSASREKNRAQSEKINKLREKNSKYLERTEELREKCASLKEKNNSLREKNNSLREKNEALKEKNKAITDSFAYKAGRFITFIPRKIKQLFRK